MALADLTLAEVLDRLAARQPAPGGGSAAALTGATAAALTEMAAAFAGAGERLLQLRGRASDLRGRLLVLADEDTRSYAPVLEALALERSDPERAQRVHGALAAAAEVPFAIAIAAAEVAELAAEVARVGSDQLIGDASAAVVLAEASARAAAALVELNLQHALDDVRLARARESAQRAWGARAALGQSAR